MGESEFNIDSFVDIVANTAGMLIIFTMLTISRVDKKGIKMDKDRTDLANLMRDIRAAEDTRKQLARNLNDSLSSAGAPETKIGLASLSKADRSKAEAALQHIEKRRGVVAEEARGVSAKLSGLKAEEVGHKTAIELAKKELADLAVEMPGFDLGELDRASLADMRQTVDGLEAQVEALTREKAAGQARYDQGQKEALQLETLTKTLTAQIANLRGDSEIEIEVRAPPARRDYARLPVLMECYARRAQEGEVQPAQYVRFLSAYERKEGTDAAKEPTLTTPREGESVEQIEAAGSEFRRFLAGQGGASKETSFLKFIVRPDAYRAFRKARDVAKRKGWEVDWQPIEPGGPPSS